jgi:serine/threonine protein kinase
MSSAAANRIPRSDITLGKLLGKGGYAEVLEGVRVGGSQVAVKRLFDGLSQQSKAEFQREIDTMCQLSSDFVVAVHGLVDEPSNEPMLLVMERMHESLSTAYSAHPPPTLRQRVEWLVQAGKGVSFFHAQSPPILHRDIKPSNMLLSSPATGRRLKMGDFGLSKSLADITASITSRTSRSSVMAAAEGAAAAAAVGTVHYMAPELMDMKPKHSPASDVYAFGVVCWETICMRLPYKDCRNLQFIQEGVRAGRREDFELEDVPDFRFPPTLKAMIERAWHQDPKQRPSIDECVRDLEQFLAQLPRDAEGMGELATAAPQSASRLPSPHPDSRTPFTPESLRASPPPPLAVGPEQLPLSLAVDVSQVRFSSSSSPLPALLLPSPSLPS